MLWKVDSYIQKNENRPLVPYAKINSNCIKDFLEKNIRSTHFTISISNTFLDVFSEKGNKSKNKQTLLHQTKKLLLQKKPSVT